MSGLTGVEINRITHHWIGVNGGYLGDFSYRTHAEFYPLFCDLDINPYKFEGTTRERFMSILSAEIPVNQAKILRGVLRRFPIDAEYKPATRDENFQQEIEMIIKRLEGQPIISAPTLQVTSNTVERALDNAEVLIRNQDYTGAIDRVHTALHGYLMALCDAGSINYPNEPALTALYRLLLLNHPKMQNLGTRSQDITQILRTFSAILDALNPIRNRASLAHPNSNLLGEDEAKLVINATRTILHYLNSKLS